MTLHNVVMNMYVYTTKRFMTHCVAYSLQLCGRLKAVVLLSLNTASMKANLNISVPRGNL